ncbi:MAG: dihydrodipicolinate synthase family protein [Tannerellaceae bacterium]|jgi:dihydrodipicolinate synthase/N-acetylneuraminate lyase|nr:dihydrodipicolinate synthase family protein [Tannerellaceae bacterium]
MTHIHPIEPSVTKLFRQGTVIPAMPLALTEERRFDERRQQALTRYYLDAGAGGIAVGVHSTQFAIRQHGLFRRVLSCVSETIDRWREKNGKPVIKIAGACGKTKQMLDEATFAAEAGFHALLLSLSAMKDESMSRIIDHCRRASEVIPVIGFYLQPAAGGIVLPYEFWKEFVQLPNILGIKVAPFNRYKTFDVVRALCDAEKENEITLYTGNDDHIILDLLTVYRIQSNGQIKNVRIKGGLLGHWCVWTQKAVELFEVLNKLAGSGRDIPDELLTRSMEITDCNAAFFDAANDFAGCIPGLHEVLFRQGLLKGTWCLDPHEMLSEGQREEISRVYQAYPHLNDDDFVKRNLEKWLSNE